MGQVAILFELVSDHLFVAVFLVVLLIEIVFVIRTGRV